MNVLNSCRSSTRISSTKYNVAILLNRQARQYTCTTVPRIDERARPPVFRQRCFPSMNCSWGSRSISKLSVQHSDIPWTKRVLRRLAGLDYSKATLRQGGFRLYEKCTDEVNFEDLRKLANLQDTFFSWFLITELHVWMCMVRVMQDGSEGRVVRNALVETLWRDADARSKKLGVVDSSARKEQLNDLNEQFMATLFLYDEGLQSNDKVLAGALWRRILQSQCDDPEVLEWFVYYVRRQVLHMESASKADVLVDGLIKWLPLPSCKPGNASSV